MRPPSHNSYRAISCRAPPPASAWSACTFGVDLRVLRCGAARSLTMQADPAIKRPQTLQANLQANMLGPDLLGPVLPAGTRGPCTDPDVLTRRSLSLDNNKFTSVANTTSLT